MNIFDRLKKRWQIESNWQVIIILIVFSCTGFSAMYAKDFVFNILGVTPDLPLWLRILIWLVTILPLYNLLLIIYGTLFGQREFFWWFLKKTFGRFVPGKGKKVTSEP
ncbi:MAG: prolipoprotein diacylglyceryl transferase [Balneolaceae bacterium]|nr:prolipoprotein diacylglyceryl transferase [Balneolaceae bacterium]MBO6545843.1 prolipoprotein diacylglyceryl transferase [Balneolaceae bacterium]MBO6647239.1 prolipoprotein diacylglyceryl transferase [Balneolaceae bacterium]